MADKNLLKDLHSLSDLSHTGNLEVYHLLCNKFCPKQLRFSIKKTLKKYFLAPFYGWDSIASRLDPLRGGSVLFTTKFPELSGTHFTDLRRMKG